MNYPVISELKTLTVSVKNNSNKQQVFNIQGTATGLPFVQNNGRVFTSYNVNNGAHYNAFGVTMNGKVYTAGQFNNTVRVVEISTNTVVAIIPTSPNPFSVVKSNGFVYVSGDGFVHIINPNTDIIISTIPTDGFGVMTLCGDTIVVSNSSGSTFNVTVIDTLTNTLVGTVSCANQTYFGSWNEADNIVYLFNNNLSGDGFTIIDIGTLTSTYHTVGYTTGVNGSLLYIPQTNKILIAQGGYGTHLYLHDGTTYAQLQDTDLNPYYTQFLILVDNYAYLSTAFDTKLYKYDVLLQSIVDTLIVATTTNDIPILGYDPYNNAILYPIADGSNSNVTVVKLDTFTVEQMFPVGQNPYSFVVVDKDTFYSVNYNPSGTSQGLSFIGYKGYVTITVDGIDIDSWSQQVSFQPMYIDRMSVNNKTSDLSLRNGLVYGINNPSGDQDLSKVSLLQFFTADQLLNIVEFKGSDLPHCIIDASHYLQGTVEGGETLVFNFWYRNIDMSMMLQDDPYVTGLPDNVFYHDSKTLKTQATSVYEKRKEQLILSKVSETDNIILVIRRKSK